MSFHTCILTVRYVLTVLSSFNYKLKIDKILFDLPPPCQIDLTVCFWPFYPLILILWKVR